MSEKNELGRSALDAVMAYDNRDVIDRYIVDFGGDLQRAKLLFDDVKRWLWMCAEAKCDTAEGQKVPTPTIFDDQAAMDDMWHTFILFTPAYVEFCFSHFGTYLHHEPMPERVKRAYEDASPQQRREAFEQRAALQRRVASYVFDKLGADVAYRWYLAGASEDAAA